jgi:hypothetical protein
MLVIRAPFRKRGDSGNIQVEIDAKVTALHISAISA